MEPAEQALRWREHPVLAGMVRVLALTLPLLFGLAAGLVVSQLLPRTHGAFYFVLDLVLITAVSFVVASLAEKAGRRLLPLAALLNLSLLFPDRAPSRFKVALRSASVRRLEHQVHEARSAGLGGREIEAAERVIELAASLSAHDRLTRGHSERVRAFTAMLAEELKLPAEEVDRLHWAALLHDVGKLTVQGSILNKAGKPDADEWEALRRHPEEGGKLVAPLASWLGESSLAVEQHHERFDGTGYPKGLEGEDICLAARMVAVADTFDVMTSNRSYKKAVPMQAARAELTRCSGTHFDPAVVRAFLSIGLGRLRWAVGPLSSLAQVPAFRPFDVLTPLFGPMTRVAMGLLAFGGAAVLAPDGSQAVAQRVPAASSRELSPEPTQKEAAATTTMTSPPEGPVEAEPTPSAVGDPDDDLPVTEPEPRARIGRTSSPSTVLPPSGPSPDPADPALPPALPPMPPRPAVAPDRLVETDEDEPVGLNLLDGQPSGSSVRIALDPTSGTVAVVSETGAALYRPHADATGEDLFSYVVCVIDDCPQGIVTVVRRPVADAPVAGDDVATVDEDASVVVAVTDNDGDADGDPLTVTAVSSSDGAVSTDGSAVTYTPAPDSHGTHTVSYTVADGTGLSASATITVTVAPVADAPVAGDDAYATPIDGTLTVTAPGVLGNDGDEDGDALVALLDTSTSAGTMALLSDGSFVYTPNPGFTGTDSFTYLVSDGVLSASATVTVQVTSSTAQIGWYFGTTGTSPDDWELTTTAPSAVNPEPDVDGDGAPGLTVRKSDQKLTNTNGGDYQHWGFVTSAPLELDGPVSLELWSTVADFDPNDDADFSVWLQDCASNGTGCVTVASSIDVHVDQWNGGVSGWTNRTISVGAVSHTVAPGRLLRLRLMFGHHDVWIASTGGRASQLVVTQPGP